MAPGGLTALPRGIVLAIVLAIAMLPCEVSGQVIPANPEFEVASVKLAPAREGVAGRLGIEKDKARASWSNISLLTLIAQAYDIEERRITGGPGWFDNQNYDVVGNLPPGANDQQIRPMLQRLLTERFSLVLRRESRPTEVFDLVVGARGPKLRKADPAATGNFVFNGRLQGRGMAMRGIAQMLTFAAHQLVLDKTGIEGSYDFELRWAPDDPANSQAAMPSLPSLFTAVQEQLGLKLESRKEQVDFLVFVSGNRVPSEN